MSGFLCKLCPRSCDARRTETEGAGRCGCGTMPVISHVQLHHWEEPCIRGDGGAGAVFFGGCALGCVFCQNSAISRVPKGKIMTPQDLSDLFRALCEEGASCIDLVTASHFTPTVRQALMLWRPPVPVVWNSSGYETVEALRSLEGLVDVYMPDMKYVSSELSARYSDAPDYFERARDAVREMVRQTGAFVMSENGQLMRGVLIRHLMLPGCLADTRRVIDWVAEEFPSGTVLFSLMGQYLPAGDAERYPSINRRLGVKEYRLAQRYLFDSSLEDGFVQDLTSADAEYVPKFCFLQEE